MTTFLSQIFIDNTIAEYKILEIGNRYKAALLFNPTTSHLPSELILWKENGKWKSSHFLSMHVLYQFGNCIDNHILEYTLADMKR